MATPILWGEWEAAFFGSGTTVVRLVKHQHKPWLYVYADRFATDDDTQRARCVMCQQLAEFMNGGARPAWLDDMIRTNERCLESLAGASIHATGPLYDKDPPKLLWFEDESDEAEGDRARLIDALFGIFSKESPAG